MGDFIEQVIDGGVELRVVPVEARDGWVLDDDVGKHALLLNHPSVARVGTEGGDGEPAAVHQRQFGVAAVTHGSAPRPHADHLAESQALDTRGENLGIRARHLVHEHGNLTHERVLHGGVTGTRTLGVEHPRHPAEAFEDPGVDVAARVASNVDDQAGFADGGVKLRGKVVKRVGGTLAHLLHVLEVYVRDVPVGPGGDVVLPGV